MRVNLIRYFWSHFCPWAPYSLYLHSPTKSSILVGINVFLAKVKDLNFSAVPFSDYSGAKLNFRELKVWALWFWISKE